MEIDNSSEFVSDEILQNTVIGYLIDGVNREGIIEWFKWKQRERVEGILENMPEVMKNKKTD